MKAYKVEILIVDFDQCGAEEIRSVLEIARYPNRCIRPEVMKVTEADIGEWRDDHPLNLRAQTREEYERLFPDKAVALAGELVAIIRVNAMRGTWAGATPEQVDEFIAPWVEKLRVAQGHPPTQ